MRKTKLSLTLLAVLVLPLCRSLASVRSESLAMPEWAVGDSELLLSNPQLAFSSPSLIRLAFSDLYSSSLGDFDPQGRGFMTWKNKKKTMASGLAFHPEGTVGSADWAGTLDAGTDALAPALPLMNLEKPGTPEGAFESFEAFKVGSVEAGFSVGYAATRNDRVVQDDGTLLDDRGNRSHVLSFGLGAGKDDLLGFKRLDLGLRLDLPGAFTSTIWTTPLGQTLYETGEMSGGLGLSAELFGFRSDPFSEDGSWGLRLKVSTLSFDYREDELISGDWTSHRLGLQEGRLEMVWVKKIGDNVTVYGLNGLVGQGSLYEAQTASAGQVTNQAQQNPCRVSIPLAGGLEAALKPWFTVRAGISGDAWSFTSEEAASGVDLSSTLGTGQRNDPRPFTYTTGISLSLGGLTLNTQVDQASYRDRVGRNRLPYAKSDLTFSF